MTPEELRPGAIRLRGVSRSFRIVHDRNQTLKEVLIRRKRTTSTELWALRHVDLDIEPGQAVGLIGQNGTGKSTLLKLVAGILRPQTGTVETAGAISSMLELGAGFHPDFSGRENVYLNGSIHGLSDRMVEERFDDILAFGELHDFIDMPVRTYSSGMYMRLAFAIASHVNPDILLLDEVLAVGDEAFQHKCFAQIQRFHRQGGTLVYVSHDPVSVARLCERVILLENGSIHADGTAADVLAEYHRLLAQRGTMEPSGSPVRGTTTTASSPSDDVTSGEWGTREVVITSVRLLGPDGPTTRFVSGDQMTVEMDVEAPSALETPVFGAVISTASGVLVYGSNTHLAHTEPTVLSGRATVQFVIPALHLHDGEFVVSVAVHAADESIVYHWLDRWLEFTVFSTGPGIGIVDLVGDWTISNPVDSATDAQSRATTEARQANRD